MSKNENGFSNGLMFLAGIAGALLGGSAGANDPEIGAGLGLVIGFLIGCGAGKILAHVVSATLQIVIALVSVAIIIFRVVSVVEWMSK